jgi:hypothetical protein
MCSKDMYSCVLRTCIHVFCMECMQPHIHTCTYTRTHIHYTQGQAWSHQVSAWVCGFRCETALWGLGGLLSWGKMRAWIHVCLGFIRACMRMYVCIIYIYIHTYIYIYTHTHIYIWLVLWDMFMCKPMWVWKVEFLETGITAHKGRRLYILYVSTTQRQCKMFLTDSESARYICWEITGLNPKP